MSALSSSPGGFDPLPRSENEIVAAAATLGLTIPDGCMAGVIANLALLAQHADRLATADSISCA